MPSLSHRSQWFIACGLALGPAISNGVARFAYGLILPAMREDLSWSYATAGWINTANAAGYLIGALLSLWLIAVLGPRMLFVGGMALVTLTLAASGLTHEFWLLTATRVAAGIGGAPVFIAGGALASTLFRGDTSRNALAIAVYFGGGGLGMLISGISIPALLDSAGGAAWPKAWLLLAAISLLAMLPSTLAVLALPPFTQPAISIVKRGLPLSQMQGALLGYFLFAVGYIVYLTFLVAWMRASGAEVGLISVTWGLIGAAIMFSPFAWRAVLSRSMGGRALSASCMVTGFGMLLPLLVSGAPGYLLSALAFGLSVFIAPAAITAFCRKNLPENDWGRAMALFTTDFAAGQTLGPIAAGFLADATNSLTLGLFAAGITLLLAAGVATQQQPIRSAT